MWRLLLVLMLVTSCFSKKDNGEPTGLEVLMPNKKKKSFYDSELIQKIEEVHAKVSRKGKFTMEEMDFLANVYARPIPAKVTASKRPNAKYLANMYISTRDIRFVQLLMTFAYNQPKDQNARDGLADIYTALPKPFLEHLSTLGDEEKAAIIDRTSEGLERKYVGKLTIDNAKYFIVQGAVEVYEPEYVHSAMAVNILAGVQKRL